MQICQNVNKYVKNVEVQTFSPDCAGQDYGVLVLHRFRVERGEVRDRLKSAKISIWTVSPPHAQTYEYLAKLAHIRCVCEERKRQEKTTEHKKLRGLDDINPNTDVNRD